MIVYTDGLTEAESSQGEVFDWCDRLWETFGAFRSGARRGDDVTFIGVSNTEALREALGRISCHGPRSRPSGSMPAVSDEAK